MSTIIGLKHDIKDDCFDIKINLLKKTQDLILQHIKNKFTAGIFYSEMEINQIIKASISFDDYVLIRREGISKNLV